MDRDVFARAKGICRVAADGLVGTLGGAPFDAEGVAQALDAVLGGKHGMPSLAPVLAELDRVAIDVALDPLFSPLRFEAHAARVGAVAQEHAACILDLQLERVARRYVVAGHTDASGLVRAFVQSVLDRLVFDARNGVLERVGAEQARSARERVHDLTAPLINCATECLMANPRKRLRLARHFHRVTGPGDDLLH